MCFCDGRLGSIRDEGVRPGLPWPEAEVRIRGGGGLLFCALVYSVLLLVEHSATQYMNLSECLCLSVTPLQINTYIIHIGFKNHHKLQEPSISFHNNCEVYINWLQTTYEQRSANDWTEYFVCRLVVPWCWCMGRSSIPSWCPTLRSCSCLCTLSWE